MITADGGTASVAGFDVAEQPSKVREQISLTGQFAAVDHVLTARENLVLMGELRHVADCGFRGFSYSGSDRFRTAIPMVFVPG